MRYFPPTKSSKSKPASKVPVEKKVEDPASPDGFRYVCNKPAWEIRRKEVWIRADGRCEKCGKWVPLHQKAKVTVTPGGEQYASFEPAADIHHKHPRGLGGSKRDDRIENLECTCRDCHNEEHANRSKGKSNGAGSSEDAGKNIVAEHRQRCE